MKIKKLIINLSGPLLIILLGSGLTSLSLLSAKSSSRQIQISLIPRPYSMQMRKGSLNLNEKSIIIINQKHQEVLNIATEFQSRLRRATSWPWEIKEASQVKSLHGHIFIRLLPTKTNLGAEGYELGIKASHIILDAPSPAGLFYGLKTLWQLFPPSFESSSLSVGHHQLESQDKPLPISSLSLPFFQIIDQPRFRWRGMPLDCSRLFFSKEWIMKLPDVAVSSKLNTFHSHLTDDQGWRIEIKKYPRLTEIGAWRRETMEDGQPYGGFLSSRRNKRNCRLWSAPLHYGCS